MGLQGRTIIENPEIRQYQTTCWLLFGLALAAALLPICLYYDLVVATSVHYQVLPGDLRTILSCAESFGHTYGVGLILLTIWLASAENRRKIQGLAGMLVANCFVIFALKNSFMRIRPRGGQASQFESVWDTFVGVNPAVTQLDISKLGMSNLQSYPSGHTSTAFILGVGLALIFPKARYMFLLFSLLAAGQRIGYQAHYLSDVCVGAIVALMMVCLFIQTPMGKRSFFGEPEVFPVVAEWPHKLSEQAQSEKKNVAAA